jgi:hypothetical protein
MIPSSQNVSLPLSIFQCLIIASIVALATVQARAATINVPAGGSLQSAINAAQPGDTIVLQAGATYTGDFVLPNKSGSTYITIQSSRVAELLDGVRVGPAQSALLARLQSASSASPIITAAAGSHHYRLIGLEIATATSAVVYDLVRFGESSQTAAQVPHDFVIDRSYIHGQPTQDVQRGVTLNGSEITVSNSSVSGIHGRGYDTQALCGWNGPGPFHIINNYLEASGENVMFGGALPSITNLVPSNIEIRRNYFFKPLSWKVGHPTYAGIHWSVKNLLELKNARNVVVDGNVIENCWTDGQIGYAVLFTVRSEDGKAPWATVENISFTNNTVKNSDQGIQMLGTDYPNPSGRGNGVVVSNNLFTGIANRFLVISGFYNVTLDHNTHFQSGNVTALYGEPSIGFVYTNNITTRSGYGFFGDGRGEGIPALTTYTPSAVFQRNLIAGAQSSLYPTNNFFPSSITGILDSTFRVVNTTYKAAGTDGKDLGCDINALNAAQSGGATAPAPTPTPTPTPTPAPTPASGSTSATFVKADTTTQGNWKGVYGKDGYNLVGDLSSIPAYAQIAARSYTAWTWSGSTTETRALQKMSSSSRVAACWYSDTFFSIDVNFTDGQTHQLALYALDWETSTRGETIDIVDASTNALIESRSLSSFNGGKYLVWNVRGRIKINLTRTSGGNAVISGLFFDSLTSTSTPAPTSTSATFVKLDTTTQGTWKGVYGREGYNLVGDLSNVPSYAQIAPRSYTAWTWSGTTTETRALQRASSGGRIAACWYSDTSFSIDVNFTDGQTHQLALYALDWDTTTRGQTVDIVDASTNAVIESRSLSSFNGGKYLVWNVRGHIKINLKRTSGGNAVISGLFFDPAI